MTVWPAGSKVKVVALLSVHDDWLNVRLHSSGVATSEVTSVPQLTPGKIARSKIGALYQYASIQILVTMENFKLISEIDQTTCTIFPKKLSGCYKCNTGGEFSYECHTKFGISIDEITKLHSNWTPVNLQKCSFENWTNIRRDNSIPQYVRL